VLYTSDVSFVLRRHVLVCAFGFVACAPVPDAERQVPKRGSLGRELYGALCDRVGAQSLREDVTGASYQDVCHPDTEGGYARLVDRSLLPPLTHGAAQESDTVSIPTQPLGRERNVARIEALAEERDPLIAALDAMLPDLTLSPSLCAEQADSAPLPTALRDALAELVPLYADGTIPNVTRALGQLLRQVEQEPELSRALSRLDARQGYRPPELALYVLEPLLSYPGLFELGGALAAVHREDRNGARSALAAFLRRAGADLTAGANAPLVPERELEVSREALSGRTRVSRPRSVRELSLDLLSAPALIERDASTSVVRRDSRGLAQVLTTDGTLPWPFMADDTGKPAVDELGRFITRDGQPSPQPFVRWSGAGIGRDALGRALSAEGAPLYAYLDVSGSVFSNLTTKLAPLVRPRSEGGQEALLDARVLEGALLGPRIIQADGDVRLNANTAPLVDIVHALASGLARPELDDALQLFSTLARERPDLLPRVVRLGLSLDAIADRYPEVELPPHSTLWDELIDVFVDISRKDALLEDLLDAFADSRTEQLGHVFAAYMRHSDDITYFRDPKQPENRDSLNGKVWNATTGDFSDLQTPVDRSLPDSGANRSVLQRFLQLLHDANGLPACSKEGAVAHVDITWPPGGRGLPIRLDYPTSPLAKTVCAFLGSRAPSRIPECGILRFENVAEMLIGVALGETEISVRDDCLNKLVSSPLAGFVGGANAFLQETSGIDGFSLEPTVPGVARLAFFDAPYSAWGGYAGDIYYPKTSRFLADVIDPVPSMVCPVEQYTDPIDGKVLEMRRCERFEDTLRGRDPNGLFPLEQLDFLPLVQPLAKAFGKHEANGSFVGLLDVLHRHWGSSRQTREECDPNLPATEARHCTQDGVVAYEPMIAAMLDEGELFAELGTIVRALRFTRVTHCDAFDGLRCTASSERDGIRVLAEAVRSLVDPARSPHLTDRRGEHRSRRNDGTFNPQATPLSLVLDAFSHMDNYWRMHEAEQAVWLGSRSTIIDSLASVTGSRESPRFSLQALNVGLPIALDLLREQIAAHCPPEQADGRCKWAEREIAAEVARGLEEPLTAGLLGTVDALLADEDARRELGLFAATLLEGTPDASLAAGIQAALIDVLQVLDDDASVRPLKGLLGRALAGANADEVALGPAVLELLSRFFDSENQTGCTPFDPHRVFAFALTRAVQPSKPGERAPLQVLLDAAYRVNRVDPRSQATFLPEDFKSLGRELGDLMLDEQSGLEQIYAILRQATASPP